MRAGVMLLVVLAAGPAHADKKIQDMTPGYEREQGGCTTQSAGMVKVATGVATLAKSAPEADRPELDKAAAALAKGSAAFTEYCTELGAFVTYLKDHANDPYRSVEREVDTRATKVSKLRREAKRLVDELAPLTRKMIPRIMKLPTVAPEPEKRLPVKFPSGRTVDLPVLGGPWRASGTSISDVVEYADKSTTAIVTVRQLSGDCSEHKAGIAKDAVDIDKPANAVWAVRYVRKEASGAHATVMMCTPRRDGSLVAVTDLTPPTSPHADAMLKVAQRMVAAFELK